MPERDVSPATEAGRRFVESTGVWAVAEVVAIEQEAAAIERRKVVDFATQVENLCNDPYLVSAARAILDELSPPSSDRGASR